MCSYCILQQCRVLFAMMERVRVIRLLSSIDFHLRMKLYPIQLSLASFHRITVTYRPITPLSTTQFRPLTHRQIASLCSMASASTQAQPSRRIIQDSWRQPTSSRAEPRLKVYNSLTRTKVCQIRGNQSQKLFVNDS